MCKTIVDEKNKCSWFRAENIDQRCTSYTNFEKKLFEKYLMKKGIYIYIVNLKKQKKVYVTDYFLFHIQYEFT